MPDSHATLWNSRCLSTIREREACRRSAYLIRLKHFGLSLWKVWNFLVELKNSALATWCAWKAGSVVQACEAHTNSSTVMRVHEAKLMWASLWGSRKFHRNDHPASAVPKYSSRLSPYHSCGHKIGKWLRLTGGRPGCFRGFRMLEIEGVLESAHKWTMERVGGSQSEPELFWATRDQHFHSKCSTTLLTSDLPKLNELKEKLLPVRNELFLKNENSGFH